MGPLAMLSHLASLEALAQAGVGEELLRSGRAGVSYGSSIGSVASLEEAFTSYLRTGDMSQLPSGIFFQVMSHTCAANLAHAFGMTGRVLAPNAACAAATMAIGLGFEAIRSGAQDLMVCGGAEELHPIVTGTFDLVQAASIGFNDRPEQTPRPFDKDRDGTVCGEGAGTLVLESEESARRRGAGPLAEVVGFGTSCDGEHMAQPHRASIVQCLHNALDNAGMMPDAIDYVNAHGTGTVLGDAAEAEAIREVFGGRPVPVSSLKGHIGHTLGASGALEMIASITMLREGYLLPTRNLETPGEDCGGLRFVRQVERRRIRVFVKNSFAFGGTNTVLVVKEVSG
jgi:3-oxoacyl-[acyl-carrier-protein] synthase II